LDTQIRILSYLSLNLYAAFHYGGQGEFNYDQDIAGDASAAQAWRSLSEDEQETILSDLGVSTQSDIASLIEDGLDIPSPFVDIGFGLRLRL